LSGESLELPFLIWLAQSWHSQTLRTIPVEAAEEISAKVKAKLIDEDYSQEEFMRCAHIIK
jgi:hypothetical protein